MPQSPLQTLAMGCNSSSVVPLGESDISGAGIKVRVNPSTPDTVKLSPRPGEDKTPFSKKSTSPPLESSEPPVETLSRDFNTQETPKGIPPPPPMAFEVPVNEESLIKKHPPKRFRRLDERQTESPLTHQVIDTRQEEAEIRRREILNQRILSAQRKMVQRRNSTLFSSRQSEEIPNWEKDM